MKPNMNSGSFELGKPQEFSEETLMLLAKLSENLYKEGFSLGSLLGFWIVPSPSGNQGLPCDITPDLFMNDGKARADLILSAEHFIERLKVFGNSKKKPSHKTKPSPSKEPSYFD